jgi:hypothetical protein
MGTDYVYLKRNIIRRRPIREVRKGEEAAYSRWVINNAFERVVRNMEF